MINDKWRKTSQYLHRWVLDFFSDIIEVIPTIVSPESRVECSGDIPQGKGRSLEYIFQMLSVTYIKTEYINVTNTSIRKHGETF